MNTSAVDRGAQKGFNGGNAGALRRCILQSLGFCDCIAAGGILDDEAGVEEQAVSGAVGLGEIGRTGNWEIGKVQGP